MNEKVGILDKLRNKLRYDNRGAVMMIGAILMLVIAVFFFLFTWMIIANLETIGKGLLYMAGAFLVIVGVAVLAKRYLFPNKGGDMNV